MWRRIQTDGGEWEVRLVAGEGESQAGQILEFRPLDGLSQPRRVATTVSALDDLDEAALLTAYRQARPIGGDYYGRPGKRMPDVGS